PPCTRRFAAQAVDRAFSFPFQPCAGVVIPGRKRSGILRLVYEQQPLLCVDRTTSPWQCLTLGRIFTMLFDFYANFRYGQPSSIPGTFRRGDMERRHESLRLLTATMNDLMMARGNEKPNCRASSACETPAAWRVRMLASRSGIVEGVSSCDGFA